MVSPASHGFEGDAMARNESWLRAGAACLVFGALVASPLANAFGPVGHRAVGGVADRLLNDKAKAQVAILLANDLNKDGDASGRKTLEEVATWANEIRSTSANRPNRHFDDIPSCGAVPATPDWCPADGECATHQIDQLKGVLGDPSRSDLERNEARKWIVHLVGDLHQPLHAATNAYKGGVKDRKGNPTDRGGNGWTASSSMAGPTTIILAGWTGDECRCFSGS